VHEQSSGRARAAKRYIGSILALLRPAQPRAASPDTLSGVLRTVRFAGAEEANPPGRRQQCLRSEPRDVGAAQPARFSDVRAPHWFPAAPTARNRGSIRATRASVPVLAADVPEQAAALLAAHAFFVAGADAAHALDVARHCGADDLLTVIEQKLAGESRPR
jgi:hypothetical protein